MHKRFLDKIIAALLNYGIQMQFYQYSKTSAVRTRMVVLPWMIRIRFLSL